MNNTESPVFSLPPNTNPARIIIIDDHPAILVGLSSMLSTHSDIQVIATLASVKQIDTIAPEEAVDVFLLDLRMPDIGGLESIAIIRRRFLTARILMISSYETDEEIFRALASGASGYITKNAPQDEIVHAIRRVYSGKRYLNPVLAKKLAQRCERDALTSREIEILHWVAKGLTNKGIGEKFAISEYTVRNHVNSIISKMQVQDRTEASVLALKRGIIQLDNI